FLVDFHGISLLSNNSDTNTVFLSRTTHSILAVIMGVFSAAGIILNVLVIVLIVRHRPLRQPLNYALVNLAVCDLGCAVIGGLPTTVRNATGYDNLGHVGCVLEGFGVAFFGIASLCTIGVISVERYIVVCYPMGGVLFQTRYGDNLKYWHAVAGVVLSWVWSFVWNIPPLFGWGSYESEGIKTSCGPNWSDREVGNMSYIIIYFLLCFAVPFVIIMVSYSRLLWTLHQVRDICMPTDHCVTSAFLEVLVARMIMVMVLAFLFTWLPYAAMALAVIMDSSLYIDPVIATIPVYFAKSGPVYNPIIYIFMNKQVTPLPSAFLR
uniref:Parapinopsin-like n=1 Tax=Gouania willdenowi TaxID=441366 RepID=A0A8C5N9Q9_GOUWI